MPETITVKDVVERTTSRGSVFDIELEDGRIVATFEQTIADAAKTAQGVPVEAEINTVQKGDFTNHYLNSIGDVKGEKPKSTGTAKEGPKKAAGGRSPAEQNRIARQWAMGRAVELLLGSGQSFNLPLSEENKKMLSETAEWLYDSTAKA